jgi:siderophore synthetase component
MRKYRDNNVWHKKFINHFNKYLIVSMFTLVYYTDVAKENHSQNMYLPQQRPSVNLSWPDESV